MIQSKLPNVGTTIFTRMSQLAAECGAINLSQGFPDFDGPPELREAVGRHIAAGHNQYAPMTGLPALREQVAKKIEQFYGRRVSADSEVTITPGATEAIFSAIQALVHPGDEVVVLDPSYDSYEPSVQLAGGRCVHVPLALPDFSIDWQRMAEAIGPRTRLVIINTPHNPSGALISREELDRLAALIRDRDIYLISDEVYEHLVFDGVAHTSVLSHEELYPRSFVVSSFGKTYHVTGWKTGYVVAPPALSAELRKVHQYVNFCGVTPLQWALADYMAGHPEHLRQLPGFYQAKRSGKAMRDLTVLPDLDIALVQSSLAWHDAQANREHFAALLESAAGADLVVLPEMFTTGFSMASAEQAEPELGPTHAWLLEQARRLGAVVTGSLIVQLADGSHRNRLLWARPDGEMLHYDKRHLFRMAGEHEHYSPGERQELFELKGWRVRPLICYDLRFPVWSRDPHDTDLLLYTANWPAPRRQHWNRLLPARAIENLCYVVAVNRIGEDGNALRYAGDSQVLDFQGDSLFNAADADGVFRVRLDAAALAAYRQRFPAYMDADRFEIHP